MELIIFIIVHTNKRLEAQDMEQITLTRKERILMERTKNNKDRKRNVQRYAVVGTVATGILLSANLESVFACSDIMLFKKEIFYIR